MSMLINCLLLLSTIILVTTFYLSNVSATQSTINTITSGNETNLPNSTISTPSTANNHTLTNYTDIYPDIEDAPIHDFEYQNRVIP